MIYLTRHLPTLLLQKALSSSHSDKLGGRGEEPSMKKTCSEINKGKEVIQKDAQTLCCVQSRHAVCDRGCVRVYTFLCPGTLTWPDFGYLPMILKLGGSDNKEPACNSGDLCSVPGWRRSSGGGHSNPGQYLCLENFMGGGVWPGYSS